MLMILSCGPAAQLHDEASITYRLKFSSSQQVQTRVIFPLPDDGAQMAIMNGLIPTDGGTVTYIMQAEGVGAALDGLGSAEATYFVKNLSGIGGGSGPPDVKLSLRQPDGGPGDLFLFVNKAGSGSASVEFEYTATRNCGNGCGGTKSWKFTGNAGLGRQPVHMDYVEEKR
jgi:hypothetical protein